LEIKTKRILKVDMKIQIPQEFKNLKDYLDWLFKKYNTPDFINSDPIKFAHRFKNPQDIEVAGFIASTLAMGNRKIILLSNEHLFDLIGDKPYEFILEFDPFWYEKALNNFVHFAYRNIEGKDLLVIFYLLKQALRKYGSLKNLFLKYYDEKQPTIKQALSGFVKEIFSFDPPPKFNGIPESVKGLIPDPEKNSACKRLNMFLRWMVRKDSVDFGLWEEVDKSKLIIPLDTHVSKISRALGLTQRKTDSWKTAEEITFNLKKFDPSDPVKYDFAIFGLGVELKELA
jgi:uncharacterized protein (TIGR02757 family)